MKTYDLKLWGFAQLFAEMACVNLVFPPQKKIKSNESLQLDTRGLNAASYHWNPSVSIAQFAIQMSKFNGLAKSFNEIVIIVELKT